MKSSILLSAAVLALSFTASAYAQTASDQAAPAKSGVLARMREHRQEAMGQLPPDKAQMYKDTMRQVYEKNKPDYEKIQKLRDELDGILTAEKFDKTAYLAKTDEMDKLYAQMRANRVEALSNLAAGFTQDERKILAKMHQHPMHMNEQEPEHPQPPAKP